MSAPAEVYPKSRVWAPYTQMRMEPPPLRIARGEGAWLFAEDGRRYIDAIASWWVTLHGHAQPRIAAAIARQAAELEQVIYAGCSHGPAEQLAERLTAIAPAGLTRVFYSDDGSTAVEVALKMALQYWANLGQPQRRRVVALDHAYHGDTFGAMAVSAPSHFTAPFAPLLFPVDRADSAYCHRCPVGKKRESCRIECLDRLETLLAEDSAGIRRIAAVIVEPLLQGAGGMIVHPAAFLAGVRRLCDRHGVLMIADEVLTGFGRTGAMFACELAGVAPDIMCLAKGLTGGFLSMSATLCREEIFAAFWSEDRQKTLFHGHSFTANPLGCAAGLASLEVFAAEPVMERIAAIAAHHERRLAELRGHPRVADARQIGVVAALELRVPEGEADYLAAIGPKLRRYYLERGVLLRPLGHIIYVLPPYAITPGDLERVWDVIAASLETV